MTEFTIAGAAREIAQKRISPVELTRLCQARIDALNPALHAFIRPTPERAIADAKAAEQRQMTGALKGKLDGIPIGHKDIYGTAGIPTTAHSRILEHNVPTLDATTVRLLAEAGTVMMGKLATHEFAMGGPSFDLPWPPPRNPWNTGHFTGGSSSGTGAAVPAGMILGGTGSDTGGSIRSPAALCGLAGIKPTYGLCSRAGILPLAYSMDHAGPLAWTVEDCAILLQAMAGYDAADPGSADRRVPDLSANLGKGVQGLRIGVLRRWHEEDNKAAPAVVAGIDAAGDIYRKLGAEVRDVTLSPLFDYHACGFLIILAEAFSVHEPWLKTRYNEYGALLRERLALGGMLRSADVMQAVRRRRELTREMTTAMQDVDILLTASQPDEAPEIAKVPQWGLFERPGFTTAANLTGFPAMSVCSGFGPQGLPIAIQLIGRPFEDATVLRAGHAYEEATPWRERRPVLATSAANMAAK